MTAMAEPKSSQNCFEKESFLFKYLLSSTAAGVAETGVDFDVNRWNKKEVDNYISAMLLEIEKGERMVDEKEKRLKEMDKSQDFLKNEDEAKYLESEHLQEKYETEILEDITSDSCQLLDQEKIYSEKAEIGLGIDGKKYEEKRKQLSEIRKAEYNAYLKKIKQLELKRKKAMKTNHLMFPSKHLSDKIFDNSFKTSICSKLNNEKTSTDASERDFNLVSQIIDSYEQERLANIIPAVQDSEIRKEIAALYKEQLDKQIKEKEKLNQAHREYEKLCEKKNEIRTMQQIRRMEEEYKKEMEKHHKMKAAFQIQEERAQKLEEFIRKDNEMRKTKFQKKFHEKREDMYLPISNFEALSVSNVLCDLSDVRKRAIRTQKVLEEELKCRDKIHETKLEWPQHL